MKSAFLGYIFDWDNTLVSSWDVIAKALNETFNHMGMTEWSIDKVKSNVKLSMRDSFPKIFGDEWEKAAQIYQENYRLLHLDFIKPLDSAQNFLDMLHKNNIPMMVVSNKRGINLRAEIVHLGWSYYFDSIIGAEDSPEDKPSALPIFNAIKDSRLQNIYERQNTTDNQENMMNKIAFIGDSVIDLEAANNAGCYPILYGKPHHDIKLEYYADGKSGKLGEHNFKKHYRNWSDVIASYHN